VTHLPSYIAHKAIQLLSLRNTEDTLGTWTKFLKVFKKRPGQDMKDAIAADAGMTELHKLFAKIFGTYFIARDYESVDAWGKKLNIMDCRLNRNYMPLWRTIRKDRRKVISTTQIKRLGQSGFGAYSPPL
jgi:hypothetical protein